MTIPINTTLLPNLITHTHVFGLGGVLTFVIIVLTLLLITRDINRWKSLALIVTVGWHIAGLVPTFPEITYPVLTIIFVIDNLTMTSIGNIISTARGLKPLPGKLAKALTPKTTPELAARKKYKELATTYRYQQETKKLRNPLNTDYGKIPQIMPTTKKNFQFKNIDDMITATKGNYAPGRTIEMTRIKQSNDINEPTNIPSRKYKYVDPATRHFNEGPKQPHSRGSELFAQVAKEFEIATGRPYRGKKEHDKIYYIVRARLKGE